MKKFVGEFKEFALRGNVMSMAIGIIIGAAFQGVITSLIDNLISPIIGIFVKQNFDALEVVISGATLRYGAFITSVINFIVLAFVVFLMVRAMNRLVSARNKEEEAAPERLCPYCKTKLHRDATRCPACASDVGDL